MSQIREVIFAINPEYDNFDDLQAYFKEYSHRFWYESATTLVFDFEPSEGNPSVSPQIKRQLFLIFKEMQNNIAKHAQATTVHITLKLTDINHYFLEIRDNGIGFQQDTAHCFSQGLSGMKQRAESINAVLTIKSTIGQGATLKIVGTLGYQ